MKQNSRLNSDESQSQDQSGTTEHAHQQSVTAGSTEFSGPEAMLRYDASQTPVPTQVTDRLRTSLAAEPPKSGGWWRRLFGR